MWTLIFWKRRKKLRFQLYPDTYGWAIVLSSYLCTYLILLTSVSRLSELLEMRSRSPWFWPDAIFNLCPPGRAFNNCLKILHGFTDKVSPRVYHSFRGQWDDLCNHPYVHPYLEKTFCYCWTSDGGWFITSWSPPIHIIPSHKRFISSPQFFKRLVVLSTEQIIVDRY